MSSAAAAVREVEQVCVLGRLGSCPTVIKFDCLETLLKIHIISVTGLCSLDYLIESLLLPRALSCMLTYICSVGSVPAAVGAVAVIVSVTLASALSVVVVVVVTVVTRC